MKKHSALVRLIHNRGSGKRQYGKKQLVELIEKEGFKVEYTSSPKDSLKAISPETSLIAIAGGDGTIRSTIISLLDKKLKYKRPIALISLGTANNIATSIGIAEDPYLNVSSWPDYNVRKFDIGQVSGMRKPQFFLESFGFGIFPKLMELMEKKSFKNKSAQHELDAAIDGFRELARNYTAKTCSIEINGKKIKKKCMMVEVMNISRLGPNLKLSEHADPSDGFFDVIVVGEDDRGVLDTYISDLSSSKTVIFPINPIRAKEVKVKWNGEDGHVDDEIFTGSKKASYTVNLMHSLVEIIVGHKKLK